MKRVSRREPRVVSGGRGIWARYNGVRMDDSAIYSAISFRKQGEISLDRDVSYEIGPEVLRNSDL